MNEKSSAINLETALKLILRLMGATSLSAVFFVAAPYAWMDAIHRSLGMGPLPDLPVVGYLTRSLSAFYVIMGGLYWIVSFDLERYRAILTYLGASMTLFGVALIGIDWWEGLPFLWKAGEGPFVMAYGLTVLFLNLLRK